MPFTTGRGTPGCAQKSRKARSSSDLVHGGSECSARTSQNAGSPADGRGTEPEREKLRRATIPCCRAGRPAKKRPPPAARYAAAPHARVTKVMVS
jgi:hypothetical protein